MLEKYNEKFGVSKKSNKNMMLKNPFDEIVPDAIDAIDYYEKQKQRHAKKLLKKEIYEKELDETIEELENSLNEKFGLKTKSKTPKLDDSSLSNLSNSKQEY